MSSRGLKVSWNARIIETVRLGRCHLRVVAVGEGTSSGRREVCLMSQLKLRSASWWAVRFWCELDGLAALLSITLRKL